MLVSSSWVNPGFGGNEALAKGVEARTGARSSWAQAGESKFVRLSNSQPATAPPSRALTTQQTISFFMDYRASKYLGFDFRAHGGQCPNPIFCREEIILEGGVAVALPIFSIRYRGRIRSQIRSRRQQIRLEVPAQRKNCGSSWRTSGGRTTGLLRCEPTR